MEHAHVLGQFDEQLYADYHAFMAGSAPGRATSTPC